jgi:hypothetical protein
MIGGAAALLLSAKSDDGLSESIADKASTLKEKAAGLGGSLGALSEQVQSLKDRVTELRADNDSTLPDDDMTHSHFIDGDALALTVEDAEEVATEVRDEIGDEAELTIALDTPSVAATLDIDATATDAVEAIPDNLKEEA